MPSNLLNAFKQASRARSTTLLMGKVTCQKSLLQRGPVQIAIVSTRVEECDA